MTIKERQRFLVLAAAAAVLFLACERMIIAPLLKSWKQKATRIVDLERLLQRSVVTLDRERAITERWASMKTNSLPAAMPVAENAVLKSVDRWAQESRISFTSLKPQWKQSGENYMTLECRADAFGSIQALSRFLFALETDPLAIKIEDVEITSRDAEGQQLSLAIRMSGLLLAAQDK